MSSYDPASAAEFFKSAGKAEAFAQGAAIFHENQKSKGLFAANDRMYLLLEGEVSLMSGAKVLAAVKAGEIFGEMGSISGQPRSATAVAGTACRTLSLDEKQFQRAIRERPEFALTLMSLMIERMRQTVARAGAGSAASGPAGDQAAAVFGKDQLKELAALQDQPPVHFDRNKAILSEGELAMRMYVVLEGRVAIQVHGNVVQRVGPGGAFGEMALLEKSRRSARAVAETDCALLPITREEFLSLVRARPSFGVSMLLALSERLRNATAKLK